MTTVIARRAACTWEQGWDDGFNAGRLAALREVREMVATRADALRKDGRNGHALNEANAILGMIDAMIAKEKR